MFQDISVVFTSGLLSTLLPVSAIGIRQTVKRQRQEIIRDLETVFETPGERAPDKIVPSFEFVKYKYFLERETVNGLESAKDFSNWSWFLSIFPFVIMTTFIYTIIFHKLAVRTFGDNDPGFLGSLNIIDNISWTWILAAAAFGAYVSIVRDIFRSINNFDLSPSLFIRSSVHFLSGLIFSMVIFFCVDTSIDLTKLSNKFAFGPLFVSAFVCGMLPELGYRYLINKSRLSNFKREDLSVYRILQTTPVEVIDGIDVNVSSRFLDYSINSVQNLATANPIMLFVETPYGIYQTIDWVAQAQLFSSVGTPSVIELWKLGIRTIFNLELAVLDSSYSTPELRQMIGKALGLRPSKNPIHGEDQSYLIDDASIIANVQNRLNDCHIHRLRQIVKRITERLGSSNQRL